ncbi:porin [Rhizobium sp. KVB221]|uniref:Porin n=1 Tax=Rhizobium setariae TaxID=2801340 RepID=A0A936YPV9_9HYPH|nr:porin [Rhizobium setariae]MBL0370591.1 porin [Rhizobium setariae]
MFIRSVLFGSVISLAAVSARAEDAIVATDPLTMERVNVCDAYGTGYTLVPGSNTCVKMSGQLRYENHFSQGGGKGTAHGSIGRFTLDFETNSD